MARLDTQVNIRIPDALLERLRASATASGRSLTAEIVKRIEESFPQFEEMLIATRSRELETISQSVRAKEQEYLRLLSSGNSGWEKAYREFAHLRMLESSIQHDIESLAEFKADVADEVETELEYLKESMADAESRDYALTQAGLALAKASGKKRKAK